MKSSDAHYNQVDTVGVGRGGSTETSLDPEWEGRVIWEEPRPNVLTRL